MATIGNQRAKQYEEEVQKAYAAGVAFERQEWSQKYDDNYEKTMTEAADFLKDEIERGELRADDAENERDMWKEKYYKMLELYEECMASYSAAVDELKNA